MNILLDTNAFLWLTTHPEHLSDVAASLCNTSINTLYLSSISANEIALKYNLKKLKLPVPPSVFIPQERLAHGIESLALDEASSLTLESLPLVHRDPFDRLLICQAMEHDLVLLTPDPQIRQYNIQTIW